MSTLPSSSVAQLKATPALAHAPVQALLNLFADELPWLSDRYGLVQTASRKAGTKTEKVPQVYRQDGKKYHFDVLPAENMQAMCFFERNGPAQLLWDKDSMQLSGTWLHAVSLVAWCNLPLIADREDDFSDQLALDVVRVLVEAGVPVGGVEQRAEKVFERYTLEDKKLLMWPFSGFRVALTLTEPYNPCVVPFSPVLVEPDTITIIDLVVTGDETSGVAPLTVEAV